MLRDGVVFVSRETAEKLTPNPTVGMISITDPDAKSGLAKLQEGWSAVLRLQFHDVTKPWQGYEPMTEGQAKELIDWLEKHEAGFTGVVVHCEHGQSRSAAVAKYLGDRYRLPIFESSVRFANETVYDLLCGADPSTF